MIVGFGGSLPLVTFVRVKSSLGSLLHSTAFTIHLNPPMEHKLVLKLCVVPLP